MEFFDSFVEWFNGLVGLQYAGYGPITAILIGMLTVVASIRILKFFFKPFAPLFQAAADLGESNPVLAQQGIRQSQLTDQTDQQDISDLFERSGDRGRSARGPGRRSHRDELFDTEDGNVGGHHHDGESLSSANDAEVMDFSEALEDAWQHDQSTELRKEIEPLRPMPAGTPAASAPTNHTDSKPSFLKRLRPTAASTPDAASSSGEIIPILRISSFGDASRSSGAANRMALRLQQGVSETLARIPNLAVESPGTANSGVISDTVFIVEGRVELQDDGVHVALTVQNSTELSPLLARDMTCAPAEMQKFEKEVALEIAAAVIAHQRAAGRSVMKPLASKPRRGEQSGLTYPSARHPSPERLHRTDRPAQ